MTMTNQQNKLRNELFEKALRDILGSETESIVGSINSIEGLGKGDMSNMLRAAQIIETKRLAAALEKLVVVMSPPKFSSI